MKPTGKRLPALLLSLVLGCSAMTGCTDMLVELVNSTPTEANSTAVESRESETPSDAETAETDTTDAEMPAEHTSPMETVISQLGTQLDTDAILDRDSPDDAGKNFKTSLSQFIQQGDLVSSFTFVFYAADGVSNIGEYKGGCGISVTDACAAKTDSGWYQSPEFTAQSQGSYLEVTWNVPGDVAPYINAGGDVQVGYWWGNYGKLNLKNVICTYTRTMELPVDSTQTISVHKTLNFNNEATQTVKVPLGDVLGEDGVPQAITCDITGQGGFRKFTGAFGISTAEDMYQTDTVAVLTDASSLSLTWIVPEEEAYNIPGDAEAMLSYWWSEAGDITLDSVTVKYSSSGSPRPERPETPAAPQEGVTSMNTDGRAAAIAADIKVGWNLGNTLDSYDKSNRDVDYETYWGNVRTSKALFDTVKAKGFNAVRIPVSWTNHLDANNTIDAAWLDRVQQIVDYAMQDDLYVILNMHHDDYTWVHPVYAAEEAVKAK